MVCDHVTGRIVWAAKGRSKATVGDFFDALGDERGCPNAFITMIMLERGGLAPDLPWATAS